LQSVANSNKFPAVTLFIGITCYNILKKEVKDVGREGVESNSRPLSG
jgi:hypothetical protein